MTCATILLGLERDDRGTPTRADPSVHRRCRAAGRPAARSERQRGDVGRGRRRPGGRAALSRSTFPATAARARRRAARAIAWYADAGCGRDRGARDGAGASSSVTRSAGRSPLRLAERHPDLVDGLVLVGPSGIDPLPRRTRVLAVLTTVLRPGACAAPLGARLAGKGMVPATRIRAVARRPIAAALSAARGARFLRRDARAHRRSDRAARDPRRRADRERAVAALPGRRAVGRRRRRRPGRARLRAARDEPAPQLRVVADCGHLLIGERPDAVRRRGRAVEAGRLLRLTGSRPRGTPRARRTARRSARRAPAPPAAPLRSGPPRSDGCRAHGPRAGSAPRALR